MTCTCDNLDRPLLFYENLPYKTKKLSLPPPFLDTYVVSFSLLYSFGLYATKRVFGASLIVGARHRLSHNFCALCTIRTGYKSL